MMKTTLLAMAALIGLSACGDDDSSKGDTAADSDATDNGGDSDAADSDATDSDTADGGDSDAADSDSDAADTDDDAADSGGDADSGDAADTGDDVADSAGDADGDDSADIAPDSQEDTSSGDAPDGDAETLVPLAEVVQIDGGANYGVALLADGTVLAWGDNATGQLGDGTTDARSLPVQVSGLGPGSGVIAVSAGNFHTMALKEDGTVLAWGSNFVGQLGDGSLEPRSVPDQVIGLDHTSGVIAISAGFTHSLALKSDGTVLCWGRGALGACGDRSDENTRQTPVQTFGLGPDSGVIAISAGANSSMAVKSDGSVWTWGNNNAGQIGDGAGGNRLEPTPVSGLGAGSDVVAVANASISGATSNYALRRDGAVFAWGANGGGQLGDGTLEGRNTPVEVLGLDSGSPVTALAPGLEYVLAKRADGTVVGWGKNTSGQLGDGTRASHPTPVAIATLPAGIEALAAGNLQSYALTAAGTLLAWGSNAAGQLGDGTYEGSPDPVPTSGLGPGSGVTALAAGASFSLALKEDGEVLAWGLNGAGQLGDGTTAAQRNVPVAVAMPADTSKIVAVAAGASHALALSSDGAVLAWGANGAGQLGDGSTAGSRTPVPVDGLASGSEIIALAAGNDRSFALAADGAVFGWGRNRGALGIGTESESEPVPVALPDIGSGSGVIAIAAANFAAYALASDGTVLAWGTNSVAQLGDATTDNHVAPVQVAGLGAGSGVTAIAAYFAGGFAVKADGTILAWGSNGAGQVGDGTLLLRPSPVEASTVPRGTVAALQGGNLHALLLREDGSVLAWGGNSSGQLGDGTTIGRLAPVEIFAAGSDVSAIAISSCTGNHSLALKRDGSVLAWGANGSGELGDGTRYDKGLVPSQVLVDASLTR